MNLSTEDVYKQRKKNNKKEAIKIKIKLKKEVNFIDKKQKNI